MVVFDISCANEVNRKHWSVIWDYPGIRISMQEILDPVNRKLYEL
jgi:hypothetical protein